MAEARVDLLPIPLPAVIGATPYQRSWNFVTRLAGKAEGRTSSVALERAAPRTGVAAPLAKPTKVAAPLVG